MKIIGIWDIFNSGAEPYEKFIESHSAFYSHLPRPDLPESGVRVIRYDIKNGPILAGIAFGADADFYIPDWDNVDTLLISPDLIEVTSFHGNKSVFPVHDALFTESDTVLLQCNLEQEHLKLYLGSISWFFPDNASADEVRLIPYDPSWPAMATSFIDTFYEEFGSDIITRMEHYGSTSIPGMPAKPILDFLVEVSSLQEAIARIVWLTDTKNWEYWWYGDHITLIKRDEKTRARTHHVHITSCNHKIWNNLVFRDRLRSNPVLAKQYADLKYRLAAEFTIDREAYTRAKGDFVRRVMRIDSGVSGHRGK
nr:GrpB family protein [uncultured Methanospirillum sp.]